MDLIRKVFSKLKVGMKVRTNGSGSVRFSVELIGEIGEISGRNIYIFSNDSNFEGNVGKKKPQSKGYEYSWLVYSSPNGGAQIEILSGTPKWKDLYS